MSKIDHPLFENMNEREWLTVVYSYLKHQLQPQASIPLEYLEDLHPTDVNAITLDMFEVYKYTDEEVEKMIQALSLIISKKEKEDFEEL